MERLRIHIAFRTNIPPEQRIAFAAEYAGHWLIESVATDIANKILSEFHPESVTVEVKKFAVPQAKYVSVSIARKR